MGMEHLIHVLNERDRRTLAWLRERFGDAALLSTVHGVGGASKLYVSTVCRRLGVTPPRVPVSRKRFAVTPAGDAALAKIKALLSGKDAIEQRDVSRRVGAATAVRPVRYSENRSFDFATAD
jgi:hypothetical protein